MKRITTGNKAPSLALKIKVKAVSSIASGPAKSSCKSWTPDETAPWKDGRLIMANRLVQEGEERGARNWNQDKE